MCFSPWCAHSLVNVYRDLALKFVRIRWGWGWLRWVCFLFQVWLRVQIRFVSSAMPHRCLQSVGASAGRSLDAAREGRTSPCIASWMATLRLSDTLTIGVPSPAHMFCRWLMVLASAREQADMGREFVSECRQWASHREFLRKGPWGLTMSSIVTWMRPGLGVTQICGGWTVAPDDSVQTLHLVVTLACLSDGVVLACWLSCSAFVVFCA